MDVNIRGSVFHVSCVKALGGEEEGVYFQNTREETLSGGIQTDGEKKIQEKSIENVLPYVTKTYTVGGLYDSLD